MDNFSNEEACIKLKNRGFSQLEDLFSSHGWKIIKNEFDHIISFYPIPGLTEYYNCKFCNSILPVKDLNKKNKNNFWNCFCFWF